MKKLCVFCGSSPGSKPEYTDAAIKLGHSLVSNNIGLVYGGANVGVMGKLANAVLEKGGEVIGVVTRFLLEKKGAHPELTDLRIVDSMPERKALMADLSDGFIALPGGLGTIEEFVEVLAWAQLGLHRKPCGLLNTCRYYDNFTALLDHMSEQRFLGEEHRDMLLIDDDPQSLLNKFVHFEPPGIDKVGWVIQMNNEDDLCS